MPEAYAGSAQAAWRWVLDQVRWDEDGPWLPDIAAHLFRLARLLDQGPDAPVVARTDSWWALPIPEVWWPPQDA
ncbi:hypothetical protein [Nocardioides sp. zg-DK7169]|uniref:hypothetical protein n=1 Tax=Nocardioides sp. zg-DK7169 TaxID=2736600 RepID=UPI001557B09F|nr:hypothetical protein [Nocardioides sp. zg-DK7169]NPC95429.1 hypothetical protein [Nocardioides sp. zg-DK7169]